jgi:glycolate oxidase FAD binding subunit
MTDGRIVKSGGHVVKNVAGYDLGKLVSGSFGTLAAIVDATFKLSPILPASQTLVLRYADGEALAVDVARLTASQLEPLAIDVHVSIGSPEEPASVRRLLVRFATSPKATSVQSAGARALLTREVDVLEDAPESALWAEQVRRPWSGAGGVIRLSWLPAALPRVLALVDDVQRVAGGAVELTGRAAVGAGFLRVAADPRALRAAVELLRARGSAVANVIVLRQPAADDPIDVWGPAGSDAAIRHSVKTTFDPAGILNAGRGPV